MKKLLITAIATAGMAFGLRAADAGFLAGTDFEDGAVPSTGWTIPDDDPNQSLVNTANTDAYSDPNEIGVPAKWSGSTHGKFLAVKTTFGKPISLDYEQDMSAGAYFDSLVKMTVCDEAPAADAYAGAKIMVWAQENADGTATSLWVRASAPDGSGWKSQDFQCAGKFDKADEWHRLTIKAIPDILSAKEALDYVPGFVVYVDGEAIQCMDAKLGVTGLNDNAAKFNETGKLFVSLVQGEVDGKNNITAVAFDGQGSLDDVTLTSTAPDFAKDYEFFTINLGENVTGFDYAIEGGNDGSTTSSLQLPYAANMVVTISNVTCADGYMFNNLTADTDVTVDNDNNTFTVTLPNLHGTVNAQAAAASFNGENFATIAKAAEAANAITTAGDYTLKLWNDCTTGGLDIDNATEGVNIIIDLAGKTITGTADDTAAIAISAGNVMITNSNEAVEGTVNVGDATAAVAASGGNVLITAGTYNGIVSLDGAVSAVITGGKFDDVNNDADALKDFLADGLALVDDNGYYVVSVEQYDGPGTDESGAYLITDERDLFWIATNSQYWAAGVVLKQTDDIALTKDFPGIAGFDSFASKSYKTKNGEYVDFVASVKDCASFTVGVDAGNVQAIDGTNRWEHFTANAFRGTYNGQGHKVTDVKIIAGDYNGFFRAAYQATIQDLQLGIADTGVTDAGETAALFVGVEFDSTMSGLTALEGGTFTTGKDAAAIVGYMAGGVVENCTNNLAIKANASADNRKIGGLVLIAQGGNSIGKKRSDAGTIRNCVNNGSVTSTKKSTAGIAGILGYAGMAVTIESCENTGAISCAAGGATACSIVFDQGGPTTIAGVNKAQASLLAANKAIDGLNFATVAGDPAVATLVKTPDKDGTQYKVMAPGATIELAAGESIKLDTNLATATVTTQVAGYQVKQEEDQGDAKVITYSLELIPVTGVTLDKATLTMNLGDVSNLVATVAPDTVLDNKVVWSVVEGDAVTVEAGAVTAVKAGTATVKAEANADSTKFATCVVTVTAPAPADWPEDPSTVKGKTAAEVFGLTGDIATADAADVASWAKGNGKVNFADKAAINVKAMLLNVENTDDTSSAEADFKFSAADLAALMKGGDDAEAVKAAFEKKYPYAAVEVKNSNVLPLDSAKAADGNAGFYQAVLSVKAAPVKEN